MEPELWNVRGLQAPPTITLRSTIKEIDLKLLKKTTKEAADYFQNQTFLPKEAALLSRVIYRMKPTVRQWKFFKSTTKLNQALLRYLNLNVQAILDRLFKLLPTYNSKDQMYLPARYLLQYLLVKLQGLGQLLKRILNICLEGSECIQLTIRIGHSWRYLMVVYSIFARVYTIVKDMLKYTCDLYSNLLLYTSKLPEGQKWLPDDYCFPELLNVWLDIDWLDLDKTVIEIPDDEPGISYYNLLDSDDDDNDDIQITDEYVVVREESSDSDYEPVIENNVALSEKCMQVDDHVEFYSLELMPSSSTQGMRKEIDRSPNRKGDGAVRKKMNVANKGNESMDKKNNKRVNKNKGNRVVGKKGNRIIKKKRNKTPNQNMKKQMLVQKINEKRKSSKKKKNKKVQ